MKFDSFEKLKSLSSNPEDVDLTDKKEISEDLTIDDGEKNEEILESFEVEDGANLTPEQLEEELKKALDEEENKLPNGFYDTFLTKTTIKGGDGIIKDKGNSTKNKGKKHKIIKQTEEEAKHKGKEINKNDLNKNNYQKIRTKFRDDMNNK